MSQQLHTVQIRAGDRVTGLRRRPLGIEVTKGPDRKLRRELEGDRILIGSHDSCDLVLTDPTISRQHCEISLVDEGYRIRDLDSLNGVKIGNIRVRDAIVSQATTIDVGSSRLKLSPLSTEVELALSPRTQVGPLLGRSAKMRRVFETIERVAPMPTTVLVTGESGTGKELAARAIHELSSRADAPLVVVDCAALPPTLIESELYGHNKGAFTGADRNRTGAFEKAQGGTLFLDELGELPLDLQTRLLGALERRQVQPLGGGSPRPIDVRVIAATNRDLRKEVNRGAFRADLYFRLAVVHLEMPPLRDRPEDIPVYIEAFVAEYADQGQDLTIEPETIEAMCKRPWHGNVRELRNALERAAALGVVDPQDTLPGPQQEAKVVSATIDPAVPFKTGKALIVESYEKHYVEALMRAHAQNITRAARGAEIDRVYLLRLLDKFGLRPTRKAKAGPRR